MKRGMQMGLTLAVVGILAMLMTGCLTVRPRQFSKNDLLFNTPEQRLWVALIESSVKEISHAPAGSEITVHINSGFTGYHFSRSAPSRSTSDLRASLFPFGGLNYHSSQAGSGTAESAEIDPALARDITAELSRQYRVGVSGNSVYRLELYIRSFGTEERRRSFMGFGVTHPVAYIDMVGIWVSPDGETKEVHSKLALSKDDLEVGDLGKIAD